MSGSAMARVPAGLQRELLERAGRHVDRVEQLLGRQPLDPVVGEERGVEPVVGVRQRAELVDPAVEDQAQELLEVEAAGHELVGQGVEQLGVRRWVGLAEVVDRVDQPLAEQVAPVAVDHVPSEPRVARAR